MRRYLFALVCLQLWAQTRMIPHVTAPNGGFVTTIILQSHTNQASTCRIQPYALDGQSLSAIDTPLAPLERIALPSTEFFGNEPVSHFTVEAMDVTVTVAFEAASGRSSPAHVVEQATQQRNWRIFAGNWDVVFDGIAYVNTGTKSAAVSLRQIDADGNIRHEIDLIRC